MKVLLPRPEKLIIRIARKPVTHRWVIAREIL
jgi:hypothetical protein